MQYRLVTRPHMNTSAIIGNSAFTKLESEWDALLSQSMTDTPFQKLAYQKAWWGSLQPSGSELVTFVTRSDDGNLLGIGCFFLIEGALHLNGCVEETDYLDLISSADNAPAVWQATLECLKNSPSLSWQTIDLCNIPEESPTREILPRLADGFGWRYDESIIEVCPTVYLPESFEAYLELLDPRQRRELSRKLRRAEGSETLTALINRSTDIDADVDSFLDLLQKSTFEKRDWLNDGRRALFHEVARSAQEGGYLQLMFTEIEGRRAAGLFNFDYNGRIWVYNSGLDPAIFSALSPGVVLTAKAIEEAIRLGRTEFDFLRGSEEYKYRFGAVDTNIFKIRIEKAT